VSLWHRACLAEVRRSGALSGGDAVAFDEISRALGVQACAPRRVGSPDRGTG